MSGVVCADIEPFEHSKCTRSAEWIMTSARESLAGPTPLCDYHKRQHERLFEKHFPSTRVTFTRLEKPS